MIKRQQIFLLVAIAILLNISGAVIGKYIALNIDFYFLVSLLLLALGFIYVSRYIFWIYIGSRYQLSYFYPFMSFSYILSLLVGSALFNEPITMNKLIGSFIIITGVIIVSRTKNVKENL